jgi:hypothetical protein
LVSATVEYFVFLAHLIPKKKPASGGLSPCEGRRRSLGGRGTPRIAHHESKQYT